MAQHEMETVKELDHDFYNAHANKFILYYSKNDEWAPLDHYNYMRTKFPNHGKLTNCKVKVLLPCLDIYFWFQNIYTSASKICHTHSF